MPLTNMNEALDTLQRAHEALRDGRNRVALRDFERAVSLMPDSQEAKAGFVMALLRLGRIGEAADLCEALFADQEHPPEWPAYLARGWLATARKDYKSAIAAYEQATAEPGAPAWAYSSLAIAHWRAGDARGAEETARAALGRWPGEVGLRGALCLALLRQRRRREALRVSYMAARDHLSRRSIQLLLAVALDVARPMLAVTAVAWFMTVLAPVGWLTYAIVGLSAMQVLLRFSITRFLERKWLTGVALLLLVPLQFLPLLYDRA